MATTQPIFIHSLFRAASTYFFQKFRSLGPDFTCYQEPFNETLSALNVPARYDRLLGAQEGSVLRHPPLDMPYFYEFWARREQLAGLYREEFAYRQYFMDEAGRLPPAQIAYVLALIQHAQGRPVLQCCRSFGRVGALRREFGGTHLHVWREPRNQWWSYKVADYFERVTQLIYRSELLPPALCEVRSMAGIDRGRPRLLRPQESYLAFYGLWLDAWLRLQSQADLSISLDGIATSSAENADCSRRLSELSGRAFDLSDVRTAGMVFTADEQAFYSQIESAVSAMFVRGGRATWQGIEAAGEAARSARQAYESLAHDPVVERNLRQTTLSMMGLLAGQEWAAGSVWSPRFNPRRLRDYWRLFRPARPRPAVAPPVRVPVEPQDSAGSVGESQLMGANHD
jgi:hypothetical protein